MSKSPNLNEFDFNSNSDDESNDTLRTSFLNRKTQSNQRNGGSNCGSGSSDISRQQLPPTLPPPQTAGLLGAALISSSPLSPSSDLDDDDCEDEDDDRDEEEEDERVERRNAESDNVVDRLINQNDLEDLHAAVNQPENPEANNNHNNHANMNDDNHCSDGVEDEILNSTNNNNINCNNNNNPNNKLNNNNMNGSNNSLGALDLNGSCTNLLTKPPDHLDCGDNSSASSSSASSSSSTSSSMSSHRNENLNISNTRKGSRHKKSKKSLSASAKSTAAAVAAAIATVSKSLQSSSNNNNNTNNNNSMLSLNNLNNSMDNDGDCNSGRNSVASSRDDNNREGNGIADGGDGGILSSIGLSNSNGGANNMLNNDRNLLNCGNSSIRSETGSILGGGGGIGNNSNSNILSNLNNNNSSNNANNTNNLSNNNNNNNSSSSNNNKKFRHQNYSKNIYIGTKNAERWEITRGRLSFKNDVEFVAYLLKLAENDTERSSSLPPAPSTPKPFANFKLEPNLSVKDFETSQQSASDNVDFSHHSSSQQQMAATPTTNTSTSKKQKRVQFQQAALNGFVKSKKFSEFGVTSTKSSKKQNRNANNNNGGTTAASGAIQDSKSNLSNTSLNDENLPEVLDCRIAEKIKSELEQKTANNDVENDNSFQGALCLKKPKEYKIFNRTDDEDEEEDDIHNDNAGMVGGENDGFRIRDRSKPKKKSAKSKLPLNGRIAETEDNKELLKAIAMKTAAKAANGITEAGEEEEEEDDDEDVEQDDDEPEEGEDEELNDDIKFNTIRLKQSCRDCTINHEFETCPYRLCKDFIVDAIGFQEYIVKKENERAVEEARNNLDAIANDLNEDDDDDDEDDDDEDGEGGDHPKPESTRSLKNKIKAELQSILPNKLPLFAEASLPPEFELRSVPVSIENDDEEDDGEGHARGNSNSEEVLSIFTKINIPKHMRFGPLIGKIVQNNDISEDCNMKYVFETHDGTKSEFISADDPSYSNWLRCIRPAKTYEQRNVNLVSIDRKAYFVTTVDVPSGCELLYWSDDCNSSWRKKHWDKTNCGGCNVKFDHPLHYRTHCSVFHDPSFSLTIRKYHCKICGEAVLGKENIVKHAAQMHDGKGAYQCQFCSKFFLRLNYLEMHRTYGCSANPQRTRPLCDFCGKKFCQPQKLKVHIKRMHSDMADVLRDFQCKLCSKLLGSRAALQRHNKEVHSRNSAVVSCPRCQKLFQNRSNLKIHMLTHSGVRPFKCAEGECTAAFTTKQCLQFHYKKVHNYTQDQMPKIERSVAYTFDAYSGGMKVDFLEQAPRRRRKSLEDQNSRLSSSMLDSANESDFSDDNIFETMKKSGKSIKDLCRNETNLSLLSSKLTSMFGTAPPPPPPPVAPPVQPNSNNKDLNNGTEPPKRKRKYRKNKPTQQPQNANQILNSAVVGGLLDDVGQNDDDRLEQVRRKQNAQLSLVETFLSTTAQRLGTTPSAVVAAAAAVSSVNSLDDDIGANKLASSMHDSPDLPDDNENNFRHGSVGMGGGSTNSRDSPNAACQNLVVSKGSKKWISDDDLRHAQQQQQLQQQQQQLNLHQAMRNVNAGNLLDNETVEDVANKLLPNRDLIARFMGINNVDQHHLPHHLQQQQQQQHQHQQHQQQHHQQQQQQQPGHHQMTHEEDENSSFLDVVDSHNPSAQLSHFNTNASDNQQTQMHMNAMNHTQSFMSSFYNNTNTRIPGAGSAASTSASMLVEAALNSVGNIMESEGSLKCTNDSALDTDNEINAQMDVDTNRFANDGPNAGASNSTVNNMSSIESLENEIKMMKNLNSFPMQIPPLPMFTNNQNQNTNNLSSCNISPDGQTPNPNNHNANGANASNDIDVDAGSTPRGQQISDSDRFSNHHQTPPSPQVISPGRDYSMFGGANVGPNGPNSVNTTASGGNGSNNNISGSSPLPAIQNRRSAAGSATGVYPDHELISPASSPAIPRYDFNNEMCRKRDEDRTHLSGQNQLSSDEENSIIAQNSASQEELRMKFTQSQMDLMYSKYESMANSGLKYGNNQEMDVTDFRNTSSNELSDLQGLDMSSRSNQVGSNYHHNFQLPSTNSSNIGLGRYHHHIYDILSEREQQQQQQQQHHQQQQQHQQEQIAMQQQQQHQSIHNMIPEQMNDQDHDQTTSVDLSRTANYVVTPPPSLPYTHPHHDMLRMVSLDLTPNTNMAVGNNRSFLSSQIQHNSRETLEQHHRLLSTAEQHRLLAASNADQHRLLVDPTAHLLMEQNNRLLGSDQTRLLGETAAVAQNRHMARGFGAYHQVASGNYHPSVRPVLPSTNHHTPNPSNYHPFPAYY